MADSELLIDLSNYKDRIGSRVKPGNYTVVVEDAESTVASTGNPMVNLWFKIQGGDYDGQTVTDRLTITEKSMFRVVGFMQAIGLPTPKRKLKVTLRQFVGKKLEIAVDDGEPYNGRIRSEVKGYTKIVGANKAAADNDEDEFAGLADPVSGTSATATDLPAAGEDTSPSGLAATTLPTPETQPGTEAADTATVEQVASEKPSESASASSESTKDDDETTIDLNDFDL
jgi:hypothetical protein